MASLILMSDGTASEKKIEDYLSWSFLTGAFKMLMGVLSENPGECA